MIRFRFDNQTTLIRLQFYRARPFHDLRHSWAAAQQPKQAVGGRPPRYARTSPPLPVGAETLCVAKQTAT